MLRMAMKAFDRRAAVVDPIVDIEAVLDERRYAGVKIVPVKE
jgi:hypothetical protein